MKIHAVLSIVEKGRLGLAAAFIASFALTTMVASNDVLAKSVKWKIDAMHTEVGFSVRHLGISKVKGEFSKYDGTITADAETGRLDGFTVSVDVSSIDTGVEKRDHHLQSDDFFGAEKFPKMLMKMKTIKWSGDDFKATVALTIRDVTQDVVLSGEFLGTRRVDFGYGPQVRAGYSASAKIDRHKFNLNFNKLAEGVAVVGKDVKILLDIETIRM